MFDDSKRLDALEGKMKAVEKSVADAAAVAGEVDKLRKWTEAEFKTFAASEDKRALNQNSFTEDVEKTARSLEGELKKALQRISLLEQQVKSLKK